MKGTIRVLKLIPVLAPVLLLAACGGTEPTTPPTAPPPTAAQSTNPALAAVNALKMHGSWQFTVTTYESGSPNFSNTITGTETTARPSGEGFTVTRPGKPTMKYVRLGTDVWYDSGTGSFTQTKSDDSYVNADFQTYYMDSMVAAAEAQGLEFDQVGAESVGGVAATHYRLADAYVQAIVANMPGVTAADWAADIWTSDADGSLLQLQWGPQSLDKVQAQTGFDYVVTAVDCDCPVKPPTTARY
ncbi:MAG TPA: hypothetical protein VH371_05050 [Candidatus Limnocylindrales bacterium]